MDTPKWDGAPCWYCGDDADVAEMVQGHHFGVALCLDCRDVATTICPMCEQRFWSREGTRIDGPDLYCPRCTSQHPIIVGELAAQLKADEARDDFNERRR